MKNISESHLDQLEIGRSVEGRRIVAHLTSSPESAAEGVDADVRVMIIAGQHGDEPLARRVAEDLLRSIDNGRDVDLSDIQLAIINNANPDGAARNQRRNIDGIDLNRDHQQLVAPETHAIHCFARAWKPDLVIDLHTYPARRKMMIQQGIVYSQDVQLDCANNLTIPRHVRDLNEELLKELLSDFKASRYQASRYTLFRKDGRIRHSTPDIVDARNGLALRLAVPTLLIEGRQPSARDILDRTPDTLAAMKSALFSSLSWVAEHKRQLLDLRQRKFDLGKRVSIRSKLIPTSSPDRTPEMTFENPADGSPVPYQVTSNYTPCLKSTRQVSLPAAYAIPLENVAVLELLSRHGFSPQSSGGFETAEVWKQLSTIPPLNDDRGKRNTTTWQTSSHCDSDLADCAIYQLDELTAGSLAAHLEPHSKYGIARGMRGGRHTKVLRLQHWSGEAQARHVIQTNDSAAPRSIVPA